MLEPTSAASFVLSRADVRALDEKTIASGTAGLDLMERAGEAIVQLLTDPLRLASAGLAAAADRRRLLVLAGSGSNGGDGFVVARELTARGWQCTVAMIGREPRAGTDACTNLTRWRQLGGHVIDPSGADDAIDAAARDGMLVLDAIFGTGLDKDVTGPTADLIQHLNDARLPVLAADIPSGLCCDTGRPLGAAVRARATATIGAAKPGLFVGEGPAHAGRVYVVDIGLLPPRQVGLQPVATLMDEATMAGALPLLSPMAHKGDRGHVLILAGSPGKSGAAILAARGALRAGAGLVTVATPASVQPDVAAALPEAMTRALVDDGETGEISTGSVRALHAMLDDFDAIVAGPGLGTGPGAVEAVSEILRAAKGQVILDADALNVLSALHHEQRISLLARRPDAPFPILTPHPGEMARLVNRSIEEVQADRLGIAINTARDLRCVLVLKGAGTIVTDGELVAINSSGNSGMACAGMGDVLAGICGAVAGRILDDLDAARLAVYAHGAAGDEMARITGGPGFLAGEVADALPAVLARLSER
ncbi:MAG TPA: NAD(P)H-hydrate dehydratase [Candidatus Limnocylindrales bacterium]|nr:NAD(P)H-hydrate dehydratase [Candidatus Limnocylindrales bacterium]